MAAPGPCPRREEGSRGLQGVSERSNLKDILSCDVIFVCLLKSPLVWKGFDDLIWIHPLSGKEPSVSPTPSRRLKECDARYIHDTSEVFV